MPAMVSIRLGLLEGIFGAANVALGFSRRKKQGLEQWNMECDVSEYENVLSSRTQEIRSLIITVTKAAAQI